MERKDFLKQRQELKNQLAVYECSIFLYELQQEASITREKTVEFVRGNTNMYLSLSEISKN